MYQHVTTLTLLTSALLSFTAHGAAESNGPWDWLEGEFTNYQQTIAEPELGQLPVRYSVTRVASDDQDTVTLVSRQYYLFDETRALRQRVYQFSGRREGWVQRTYSVAIEADVEDSNQWSEVTGCSMQWQETDQGYAGHTNPSQCFFVVGEEEDRVSIHSTIYATDDGVTVADTVSSNADSDAYESSITTEFRRMTYYVDSIEFRPTTSDDWRDVELVRSVHDQGGRVGLIEAGSKLELRYQVEVLRDGGEVEFRLFDITRQEVIYSNRVEASVGVIEYESASLRIRLEPRP